MAEIGNPNIAEDGKNTRFSKDNQPKNAGRKPSKLKKYFKNNNVSIEDRALLFENVIDKTDAEILIRMAKTKKYENGKPLPGTIWGFIVAWVADTKRGWSSGGINAIMQDRKYGKAKENIELSGSIDIDQMTHEETQARIQELLDKRKASEDV